MDRRSRFAPAWAAVATFLLLALAPVSVVAADPGTDEVRTVETLSAGTSPAVAPEPTDEEMRDLAHLAETLGQDLDSTVAQFGGQGAFYDVLGDIRENTPEQLVTAEWGEGAGLLVVRPGFEETALDLAAEYGAVIEVESAALPTESEQSAFLEAVSDAASESGLAEGYSASYDWRTNTVTFDIAGAPENLEELESELVATQGNLLARSAHAKPQIEFNVVEAADIEMELAARGGEPYADCTGGFMARSGGFSGIATAHHCVTKPATYNGATTGSTAAHGSRDVRWTRLTSGSHSAVFRSGPNETRTVTHVINPVVGASLCKYGRITGYTCSTVNQTGLNTQWGTFPRFYDIIRTNNRHVVKGDSGGPWFFGGRAYGTTTGYVNSGDTLTAISAFSLMQVSITIG